MIADLSHLNAQQREAVLSSVTQNTVLVAGAGSGKTASLKARTAYLVNDLNISPMSIMVVTFTNKAATELKERIGSVCPGTSNMWIGTFHSICVRLLRLYGSEIGIRSFTILDDKDAKHLMKKILTEHDQPIDNANVSRYLDGISSYKNNLILPKQLEDEFPRLEPDVVFIRVYEAYQKETWKKRTFDFDDLIYYTVQLLLTSQRTREWIHRNILYLMVDESQDTSSSQFKLVQLLTGDNNLLMVGDDDQSIYSFRDAKPEYLLQFETYFEGGQMLKLEQNYRSTKCIIEASNHVIACNTVRASKTMFTENAKGNAIASISLETNRAEAEWIAKEIKQLHQQGVPYNDQTILYRTKSQTRLLEEYLIKFDVPYHMVNGFRFYDREEIKNIMAYLRLRVNPRDELALRRLLKQLPHIGDKTIDDVIKLSVINNQLYAKSLLSYPFKTKQQKAINDILPLLTEGYTTVYDFVKAIITRTGVIEAYTAANTAESRGRIENIKEFLSIVIEQEGSGQIQTLDDFVANVALATAKDDENKGVSLMTLHASKGLEFDYVFISGVEEGLLPHRNSLQSPPAIEEERRLMYVGMTRARKQLYLTHAKEHLDPFTQRTVSNPPSRFLKEIPKTCLIELNL